MYFSSKSSSSRESLARVRMCMMTVPVVRGEMLMGGTWQRPQFAVKTSSPSVFAALFCCVFAGFDDSLVADCGFEEARTPALETRMRIRTENKKGLITFSQAIAETRSGR